MRSASSVRTSASLSNGRVEADALVAVAGASSTRVPKDEQPGHFPNQRGVDMPHSEHEKIAAGAFAFAIPPAYGARPTEPLRAGGESAPEAYDWVVLVGREEEQRRIESVLAAARQGSSAVLVLRGEAGIGKTALLEHAAASARAMRVVRTRGIQTESELPFAGLLELLRPLLGNLDRLPERQADALKGALALEAAAEDDSFAVFAGTLNLLAAAGEDEPLLLLIDDAHWLDHGSAEALAFATRRLGDERVAVLWAIRDGEPAAVSTEGLEEIILSGIDTEAAVELVAATGARVAPEAARNLATLTNGNPLALLELPQLLSEAQREGTEPLEQPLPASPALRDAFGRRLQRLPDDTRTMVLIAAASDSADVATIVRAWEANGLTPERLEPAERANLVAIRDGQLEFRHPLVRAAVYAGADAVERREAHAALAEALYDARTQSRRAWHRALAAVGPDEAVAADLETVAVRSQGRSWHAAARAYEQAARLTPDDEMRARRLLAAAREWQTAGRGDTAWQLLEEATTMTEDAVVLADVEHLRGQELVASGRLKEAAELLERAAERIVVSAPERAALILADAADASVVEGDLDRAEECASRAWELSARDGPAELWVALRYGDVLGWRGSVERASELWLRGAEIDPGDNLRNRWAVGEALFSAGEDERARDVLEETIALARSRSSLGVLPGALHVLSMVETRRGRVRAAIAAATEAHELAVALGQTGESVRALALLAWTEALLGREDECRGRIRDALAIWQRLGVDAQGSRAEGMLNLSLGRFEDAITHFEAKAATMAIEADAIAPMSFVPSLVEAYARARRADDASAALATYERVASRSGRPAAIAPALRCRALLEGGADLFEAALAEHDRWDNQFERARTQLAYGEYLRREKQRVGARGQLRAALETFEDVGAVAWADRTRTELRATGERARKRDPSTLDDLTPQELNVARLVCKGLTNREIAERLFLSPKTIESHLVHVFRKVGVRSRTELAVAVAGSSAVVAA
jgi:DNA-binding CsgD family transcriptional regulator